ncbi:MAG TPA: hypothetical protein VKA19_05355 [Alphaproteobacteria bacterium]|nr:hypothetical protein [Alphaproteobacteria bacterium]
MARGSSLATIVDMVRYEARLTTNPAGGVDAEDRLKHYVRRTQQYFYDEFDWPFMRFRPEITLSAGERYYDFPSDFNLDQIEKAVSFFNGLFRHITYGITFDHFNAINSDLDTSADHRRADPVQAYEIIRQADDSVQIEVWPIPDSNGGKLYFFGKRNLSPLVADTDTADMDDYLLALSAASEILAANKAADAQSKAALAAGRLMRLRANASPNAEPQVIGGGRPKFPARLPLIAKWNVNG